MSEISPKISIITLTYKDYSYLFKTIKSILDQDCSDFEYIISDDGSGNFPEREVIDFVNNNKKNNLLNFELFVNENNVGTVKHLNNVIKRCRGEYIFDISGNDYLLNNHVITNLLEVFEYENCDVLIVSRLNYKNGKINGICPHYSEWKKIKKLDTKIKRYSAMARYEHYGMFIGTNTFYKKEVIEKNGYFDEKYILLEDAPMILKMFWNNNVSIRPDIFAVVYECENGVSSKKHEHPLLKKDLHRFNLYEKIDHYSELDFKTKYHIQFGIKREKAKNKIEFAFVCLLYFPRIIEFLFYCIIHKISGIKDKKFIEKNILSQSMEISTK